MTYAQFNAPEDSACDDPIRRAISDGRASIGTWHMLGSAAAAELLAEQGFPWLLIDLQHGSTTWDNLATIITATELGDAKAIVRVGWNDPAQIMRALDLGAMGVVVPMISSASAAAAAADAARYPPAGNRSFGPVRRFQSVERANAQTLCFVMIETAQGLQEVDEIMATPGVDGAFVGPADLALSTGASPSATMSGKLLEHMRQIAQACHKHGKIAGSAALSHSNVQELIDLGYTLLTIGSDGSYLRDGAARDISFVKTLQPSHSSRQEPTGPL